jgi:hypothetical protein
MAYFLFNVHGSQIGKDGFDQSHGPLDCGDTSIRAEQSRFSFFYTSLFPSNSRRRLLDGDEIFQVRVLQLHGDILARPSVYRSMYLRQLSHSESL